MVTPMIKNYRPILLLFIYVMLGILIGQIFIRKAFLPKSTCALYTLSIKNPIEIPFQVSPNVQIINLSQPINADFKCINTKKLLNFINTTICLHETKNDRYVSNSFHGTNSIWEEEGVKRILQLLIRHPYLDFIDIGANIGTYTMYAAALGRFVLAIDCFAPNINRIHRAVQITNVANRVVLIQNAIFTHSGQYLYLKNYSRNIGGQELDISKKLFINQNVINNPYIVKTIKFDELLPILVARGVRGAIIKMDIERSESFVVESGSRVFDTLEIPFVQMEWMGVRSYPDRAKVIIDFFVKRNYDPKTDSCKLLSITQHATWPGGICWIKRNVSNFC
ncbi:unnamed protein product [Rotaria sordida]|uniref:Methyltransferase FkbM domain-containing protein n=2 Tax=Rotaria sordida TaxID=392033 RepID=A0A818PI17_9BILA|nr:unnamed protein product [Rotaria sordida]